MSRSLRWLCVLVAIYSVSTGHAEDAIGWMLALFVLATCGALLVFLGVLWLKVMMQAFVMIGLTAKVMRWLRL